MTFGSLFTGIGGMDLGLERAGMKCKWQVEIDSFCQKVLARQWPEVKRFGDIRDITGDEVEPVDLIAGGFPCQDVSWAGKRVGLSGARSGLWREFYRIICRVRPRFALVENVPGLLDRGMGEVLGSLSEIGYDAEWHCLSACAFGAPHTRERVFIVAYPKSIGQRQLRGFERPEEGKAKRNIYWAQSEPKCERLVNGIPDGMDRLKSLGNAVVPQVAEWIGRRILEFAQCQ